MKIDIKKLKNMHIIYILIILAMLILMICSFQRRIQFENELDEIHFDNFAYVIEDENAVKNLELYYQFINGAEITLEELDDFESRRILMYEKIYNMNSYAKRLYNMEYTTSINDFNFSDFMFNLDLKPLIKVPGEMDAYVVSEEIEKSYDMKMIRQLIEEILEFNKENSDYYNKLKNTNYSGFIRDKKWLELLKALDKIIKENELYN